MIVLQRQLDSLKLDPKVRFRKASLKISAYTKNIGFLKTVAEKA